MTGLLIALGWIAFVGLFIGAIWLSQQKGRPLPPGRGSGFFDGHPFYESYTEAMRPDLPDDEAEAEFIAMTLSEK